MSKAKSLRAVFAILFLFLFASCFLACNENQDEIQSIYIKDGSYSAAIQKGTTYDTSNILVYAKYVKKADEVLKNSDITFSPVDTSTVGNKTLTASIKVNDKTITSSEVTVKVYGDLQSIDLKSDSFKAKVLDDELDSYDTSKVSVRASYEGDYEKEIARSELSVTFDKDHPKTDAQGKQYIELTATYGGKTATANVYVYENKIVSLNVKNLPDEMRTGDELDFDLIVVNGKRSDDELIPLTKDANDGYVVSAFNTQEPGQKEITFSLKSDDSVFKTYQIVVYGDVLSVEIDETTAATQVSVGGAYSTANTQVTVTYDGTMTSGNPLVKTFSNARVPEISKGLIEFSDIDTSVAGDQILTATVEDVLSTNQVTVHVINDVRGIINISQDENYEYFELNVPTNTYNATGSTGTKGFVETENRVYQVGTDNGYFYRPVAQGYVKGSLTFTTEFVAQIKVEKVVSDELLLDVTDDKTIVSFDTYTHEFNFTKAAEGNEFVITIKSGSKSASATVYVTDGYNVQTNAQLSVFDNVNVGGKWTDLKTENGLLGVSANKLILHKNITLTTDDLPAFQIWTKSEREDLEGAMKNWDIGYGAYTDEVARMGLENNGQVLGIVYRRVLENNESFEVEGNFFQIDASHLPLMLQEANDPVKEDIFLSCTGLFGCEQKNMQVEASAQVTVKNLALLGNSQKDEGTDGRGGIMAFKNRDVISHFENNFSQRWYISYMTRGAAENVDLDTPPEELTAATVFEKVTTYDNYNCLIYLQGDGRVEINNSIMIGAGGPVMIVDHAKKDSTDDRTKGRPVYVYEQGSILESYVIGSEAWFVGFHAEELAMAMSALNHNFVERDYNYLKKFTTTSGDIYRMNIVAVFKADTVDLDCDIRGMFTDQDVDQAVETPLNAVLEKKQEMLSKCVSNAFENYLMNGNGEQGNVPAYQALYGYAKSQEKTDEQADDYAKGMIEALVAGYTAETVQNMLSAILFQTHNGGVMVTSNTAWIAPQITFTQLNDLAVALSLGENYFTNTFDFGPNAEEIGTNPPSSLNIYIPNGIAVVLGGFEYVPESA